MAISYSVAHTLSLPLLPKTVKMKTGDGFLLDNIIRSQAVNRPHVFRVILQRTVPYTSSITHTLYLFSINHIYEEIRDLEIIKILLFCFYDKIKVSIK